MTGEPRVRVAAIDDDTLIRDGLRVLVPGVDVVAACQDVAEFLAVRPDVEVVLLDLTLTGTGTDPVLQGADAVAALAADGWRVLVYTNERRLFITEKTASGYMDQVKHKFAAYLREHSPADLERALGLEPAGLTDRYPRDPPP